MFKSLHIKNFQSHNDTQLNFHPNVNIIVGNTDSGKTAIIRALHWVLFNKPGGDAFRSTWGGETRVELTMEESNIVTRVKDTGINSYLLNEDEFHAFGVNIPEEIEKSLNLSEINAQKQFAEPFLLTQSSGEVAVHFNKIAHIEKIDKSNKQLSSWIRTIEQDIKATDTQLTEADENLLTYDYLDDLEKDVEVIEQLEEANNKLDVRKDLLEGFIYDIDLTINDIEQLSPIFEFEEPVDSILEMMEEEEQLKDTEIGLVTLKEEIIDINEDIILYETIAKLSVDDLIEEAEQLEELKEKHEKLKVRMNNIIWKGKILATDRSALKQSEDRFHELMGDVCQLCGQKIKK